MKVLVIGNGGREHAIATALAKSNQVKKVYLTPKTAYKTGKLDSVDIAVNNTEELLQFAEKEAIDLVVVGPELPLNLGIVDAFKDAGIAIFGPHKAAAYLEGSKKFAKDFMIKYEVPTAGYVEATTYEAALEQLGIYGYPMVIKADGLCAGKGVYIAKNEQEARKALEEIFLDKRFGSEGNKIIVEEFLKGPEASMLCFVSGNKIYPMATAMDYKKIFEGDKGPNTGGVGSLSPNPYWNDSLEEQNKDIIAAIEKGLAEEKLGYSGILFIGYIIVDGKLKVLEFNTRFGDPETEVVLNKLTSDLYENIMQSIREEEVKLSWDDSKQVGVILTSKGYPNSYEKGFVIEGLEALDPEIVVYHNGTALIDGNICTNGGRVLTISAAGNTFEEAREKVYANLDTIVCSNLSYRKDIALLEE